MIGGVPSYLSIGEGVEERDRWLNEEHDDTILACIASLRRAAADT